MNSILTYIAGLLVVLLFAALVGPSLVDWNQFRGEIEAQATEAAGRPVSIDGDIRFRILPAPHVTLGKIKIGNDPETSSLPSDPHFATFDEVDAEMALAPLLSGDIKITSVRVVRPQINLEILPDSTVNWRGLNIAERMPRNGMFSLASISLEKAIFEDGTVRYRNRVNGRNWKAEQVGGNIIATSLLGPLRSELEATVDGVPMAFRLGLGSFASNKAFRVTAEAETLNHPVKFLFSGVATEFTLAARLDGNGRIEIGSSSAENDGEKAAPIRMDAGLVLNARRGTARNLTVTAAGATLSGSAEARWERRPTFSVQLSTESFGLDPLLDGFSPFDGEEDILTTLLTLPLPDWMDGGATFEAGTLMLRDSLVREAKVDLSLREGVLDVETIEGELGGATQVSLMGTLRGDETERRFEGSAEVTSGNISALASWLTSLAREESEIPAAPRNGGPFSAAAKLSLAPQAFSVRDLVAAYADNVSAPALRGDLGYLTSGERPHLNARVDIADFDFDPLIALLPETSDPLSFADTHDIELSINAERLIAFERIMKGVAAEMALKSGSLAIARLDIDDLSGARLAFSGALDGVTSGERDDVEGNFTGTIKAERFGGLLELGGFDVPDVEGPVDLVVTGLSGEADDSQARVDTLTLQGRVRGSRVDGVVKRRHEAAGGVGSVDIIANAANEEGRILLEQLGLSPRKELPGTGAVSVQMTGKADGTYETSFRVNVNGTTLTARGEVREPFKALKFAGRTEIAASGVMHALGAFGAPDALTAWVADQASGPGFVFSSDVVWDKDTLALNGFESIAGNFRLSGTAGWRAAVGGKLPSVTGTLEANSIDLTSLVMTDEEDDGVWSVAAIDWTPIAGFDGEVQVKAGRVVIGPFAVEDATSRVAVSHGVLTASPFTGIFADGRISIDARIEGGAGEPGIGLTVLAEEADIAKAFESAFGGAPGTGRIDFSAQLQGQGRSWLALISSTSGEGTVGITDADFSPLDIEGFGSALEETKSIDDFAAVVQERLRTGSTSAEGMVGGGFTVKDGIIRFADNEVTLDGAMAKISAQYDLPRLASSSLMEISLDEPAEAPAFSIAVEGRPGRMDVEFDTLALQDFIARRILAESVRDAGADVPQDLRDLMDLPQAGAATAVPMPRPSIPN